MTNRVNRDNKRWTVKLGAGEITMRHGNLDDFEGILNIDWDISDGRDSLPVYFHELVANPFVTLYLAEDQGKVVAFRFTELMEGGDTVYLGGARAKPSHRKQGIVTSLIKPGGDAGTGYPGVKWLLWAGPLELNMAKLQRLPPQLGVKCVLAWKYIHMKCKPQYMDQTIMPVQTKACDWSTRCIGLNEALILICNPSSCAKIFGDQEYFIGQYSHPVSLTSGKLAAMIRRSSSTVVSQENTGVDLHVFSLGFAYKVRDGTLGVVTFHGQLDLGLFISHISLHMSQFYNTYERDRNLHLLMYFREEADLCEENIVKHFSNVGSIVSSGSRGLFKGPLDTWLPKAQL